MPIYEYESLDSSRACEKCSVRFEVLQRPGETFLALCPECGAPLKRVVSRCRATVVQNNESHSRVEKEIKAYEREGKWSHAAELAEKESSKSRDVSLQARALDNYKKAGYDSAALDKYAGKKTGQD